MKKYLLIACLSFSVFCFSQDKNQNPKSNKSEGKIDALDEKTSDLYDAASKKIEKEDFKGASDDLNKLLEINPALNFVRYNFALALFKSGDLKAAQEQYLTFLNDNPGNENALFNLSIIKSLLNDYEGAIETLTSLIKLDEKKPNNYLNRGLTYFKIDKKEEAFNDWKLASKLGSKEASDLIKQFSK